MTKPFTLTLKFFFCFSILVAVVYFIHFNYPPLPNVPFEDFTIIEDSREYIGSSPKLTIPPLYVGYIPDEKSAYEKAMALINTYGLRDPVITEDFPYTVSFSPWQDAWIITWPSLKSQSYLPEGVDFFIYSCDVILRRSDGYVFWISGDTRMRTLAESSSS